MSPAHCSSAPTTAATPAHASTKACVLVIQAIAGLHARLTVAAMGTACVAPTTHACVMPAISLGPTGASQTACVRMPAWAALHRASVGARIA